LPQKSDIFGQNSRANTSALWAMLRFLNETTGRTAQLWPCLALPARAGLPRALAGRQQQGAHVEQRIVYERYPIFTLDVPKSETDLSSIDALAEHFRLKIEAHHFARFIAVFDHYSHTRALAAGEIDPDILDAKNVVFCFGMSIPNPEILALRPRSIGIAELRDRFVISFLETPMPIANAAMERWAHEILRTSAKGNLAQEIDA
jgi:hypothetical protein